MDNQENHSAEIGIAAKKLMGMEVYTIHEGDSLGNVKDLLIDPVAKKAVAVLVEKKGLSREARLIPFEKVSNIGENAVVVADRGSVARAANLPHMVKYLERPAALYGIRIITTQGISLGRMEEYHIHRKTGAICQLDIIGGKGHALSGHASLDGQYLLTMGRAAIMVDGDNAQALINRESQLQQVVSEVKEKAGQAWQNTVTAGRRLGQNLSSSINRILEEEDQEKAKEDTPPSTEANLPETPPEITVKEEQIPPEKTETSKAEPQAEETKEKETPQETPIIENIPAEKPVKDKEKAKAKTKDKDKEKTEDKPKEKVAKKEKKTTKKTEKTDCPPPSKESKESPVEEPPIPPTVTD